MRFNWTKQLFVDLGSSYTKVSVPKHKTIIEQSCIAFFGETRTVVAFGQEAAAYFHLQEKELQIAYPIQGGVVASPQAATLFLNTLLKRLDQQTGETGLWWRYSGRIAHPSDISPAQLHILRRVMTESGLQSLRLTPQSQALAAYCRKEQTIANLFMCDIGADTTELSVFIGPESLKSGTIPWGGKLVTEVVQKVVAQELACEVTWQAAEEIKQTILDLSFASTKPPSRSRDKKFSVKGKDTTTQLSKTVVVQSSLFDSSLSKLVRPLQDGIELFIDSLPAEVMAAIVNAGMRVSGGGALLQGTAAYLEQLLAIEAIKVAEPVTAVCQGLALLDQGQTKN
ncbi:rod shape-determining protein [Candidatus Woesebacteria bacterium]|nr:rod shape-determining protein [Candidatus Woesebacteria bacterium]